MDREAPASPRIAPNIPQGGLREVLSSWSGRGQLWEALASIQGEREERVWSATDVRRRAHRVLMSKLEPSVDRWPLRFSQWTEALPAELYRERLTSDRPLPGTSWVETRRFGWPPRRFAGRSREREADTLLITTLRWVLERLSVIASDAAAVEPSTTQGVARQLEAALSLLAVEPVASAAPIQPSRTELAAVSSEGAPWNRLATTGRTLRTADTASLPTLAEQLIFPHEDLRPRLFHLAVFGELLVVLKERGWHLVSKRPLSGGSPGPAFEAVHPDLGLFDLWFEAAGMWRYYRRTSPYSLASASVMGAGGPLGADIVLVQPKQMALLLECKYSADPSYVARDGYLQALAYGTEAHHHIAPVCAAYVIGPADVVASATSAGVNFGTAGMAPPTQLGHVVDHFLSA